MDVERARVARIYLGGLLGLMAAGQALSWGTFVRAVDAYGLAFPTPQAVVLIGAEAIAAAGLLIPRADRRVPATIGLVVAVAWTALATQAFVRGLDVGNCGCFGSYLPQRLRWWVLLEDAAFVGLAGWVLHTARRRYSQRWRTGGNGADRADDRDEGAPVPGA